MGQMLIKVELYAEIRGRGECSIVLGKAATSHELGKKCDSSMMHSSIYNVPSATADRSPYKMARQKMTKRHQTWWLVKVKPSAEQAARIGMARTAKST